MKVLIVSGSRKAGREHVQTIRDALREVDASCLIHGDAAGVDNIAADHAISRGWIVIPMPAQWERHGKRAGMIRNGKMIDIGIAMAACGHSVSWLAFPAVDSIGTRGFISLASGVGISGKVIELP